MRGLNQPPVLAIDGPAAAGKTVVGQAVARALGWHFFDTGVLYRALTWKALNANVALDDDHALEILAVKTRIEVRTPSTDHPATYAVSVDGVDVSQELRAPAVDQAVSQVSAHASVRTGLIGSQRALRREPGVVMAGRDIGTVIFPDALVKIYLDASAATRAHRRALERGHTDEQTEAVELARVNDRDQQDQSRETAPLMAAPDAVIVHTDELEIDEVVRFLLQLVEDAKRSSEGAPQ